MTYLIRTLVLSGILRRELQIMRQRQWLGLLLILSTQLSRLLLRCSRKLKFMIRNGNVSVILRLMSRLFGVTTLDVVRAARFVSELKNTDPEEETITVVGGHSGVTIVPLLSQSGHDFKGKSFEWNKFDN